MRAYGATLLLAALVFGLSAPARGDYNEDFESYALEDDTAPIDDDIPAGWFINNGGHPSVFFEKTWIGEDPVAPPNQVFFLGIGQFGSTMYGGQTFSDFDVTFRFNKIGGPNDDLNFMFRVPPGLASFFFPSGYWIRIQAAKVRLEQVSPTFTVLTTVFLTPAQVVGFGAWHTGRVIAEGNRFQFLLNGDLIFDVLDPADTHQSGLIGFRLERQFVAVDDINLIDLASADQDGDGVDDSLDNCVSVFNPDQVDRDGDGAGDPCDPAPANPNPNAQPSTTDAATVTDPADPAGTTLTTPDGAAGASLPQGLVTEAATLTIVKGETDFEVVGETGRGKKTKMRIFTSYAFEIGGSSTFDFGGGLATVTFVVDSTNKTDQAFANNTLAIAGNEDTDGDGVEDTFVEIPNCASGQTTADGRCTTVTPVLDGGGNVVAYLLQADVPHFSTYAAAAIEFCPTAVDTNPKTLNLQAGGKYITVYIEFDPSTCAFGPEDVDVATVTLEVIDPVVAEPLPVVSGAPTAVGDGNGNGVIDRMLKFDRATIQSWFPAGSDVLFRVEGNFLDGTLFRGDDPSVRVIAGLE